MGESGTADMICVDCGGVIHAGESLYYIQSGGPYCGRCYNKHTSPGDTTTISLWAPPGDMPNDDIWETKEKLKRIENTSKLRDDWTEVPLRFHGEIQQAPNSGERIRIRMELPDGVGQKWMRCTDLCFDGGKIYQLDYAEIKIGSGKLWARKKQ